MLISPWIHLLQKESETYVKPWQLRKQDQDYQSVQPSFLITEKIEIRNCWCFCVKFKHSSQVLKALLQLACWTFEISKINHCTWITWKQFHLAWTVWLASTQVQTSVFVASSFIHPNPVGVQSSSLDHCDLCQITKNVCNKLAYHKSFWFRSKLCLL